MMEKQKAESRKQKCLLLGGAISAFCLLPSAFCAPGVWSAHPSDGVDLRLTREDAINRLDFDFHGRAGYAIARTRLDIDLPPNYQFVFRIRGEAPPENVELKLIGEGGDNVW